MKRYLLLLLTAIVACLISQALTFVTSDAKMENLKGPVKSVKTYTVSPISYYNVDTINEYKRLGKPLPEYKKEMDSEAEYNLSGMKTYQNDWFIEHITFNPKNDRTLIFETEKRYDSDGSLRRTYSQTFDEDWLPTSGKAYDGSGNLIFTETYKKDNLSDGRINLYSEHTGANGSTTFANIILRPDLSMELMSQKSMFASQDIHFDKDENPIKVHENKNGNDINIEIEYSAKGRKVYQIDNDGNRRLTLEYINDQAGNPVTEIKYNDNGEMETTVTNTYIYDSNNNWVKKESKSTSKSEPVILERVISYY